jgi:two-component system response regulator VicR
MLRKILIVEDDPDILDILTYILEADGYLVVRSEDGKACEHLADILPDLILMDVRLKQPGENGDMICRRLKSVAETRRFPVILLSAEFGLPELSKACGADGFISKPFDLDLLKEKVGEMLGRSNLPWAC